MGRRGDRLTGFGHSLTVDSPAAGTVRTPPVEEGLQLVQRDLRRRPGTLLWRLGRIDVVCVCPRPRDPLCRRWTARLQGFELVAVRRGCRSPASTDRPARRGPCLGDAADGGPEPDPSHPPRPADGALPRHLREDPLRMGLRRIRDRRALPDGRRLAGIAIAAQRPGPRPRCRWRSGTASAPATTCRGWSITAIWACNTSASATPIGWPPTTSSPRWAAMVTVTTTPWPRASTASTSGARLPAGPMAGLDDVGYATMTYVDWFNHRRLHGTITPGPGYTTPAAHDAAYYRQTTPVPAPVTQEPERSRNPGRFKAGTTPVSPGRNTSKITPLAHPRVDPYDLHPTGHEPRHTGHAGGRRDGDRSACVRTLDRSPRSPDHAGSRYRDKPVPLRTKKSPRAENARPK